MKIPKNPVKLQFRGHLYVHSRNSEFLQLNAFKHRKTMQKLCCTANKIGVSSDNSAYKLKKHVFYSKKVKCTHYPGRGNLFCGV